MSRSEALAIGLTENGRRALVAALAQTELVESATFEDALASRRPVQVVIVDATEAPPTAAQLDAVREAFPHVPRVLLGTTTRAPALLTLAEDYVLTVEPGVYFPYVETHIMEHGLYMLEGQGLYLLANDWHEVQQDDFIWMGPYCPQHFYCTGWSPAAYLLYKDVNRDIEF